MITATLDSIAPKRLSETELLRLFAVLYDETMPLAYVNAVGALFAHVKACTGQDGHFADVRIYDHVSSPTEVQALYAG